MIAKDVIDVAEMMRKKIDAIRYQVKAADGEVFFETRRRDIAELIRSACGGNTFVEAVLNNNNNNNKTIEYA